MHKQMNGLNTGSFESEVIKSLKVIKYKVFPRLLGVTLKVMIFKVKQKLTQTRT